jgi:predicted enzyme related to lactoylglutathione lyase
VAQATGITALARQDGLMTPLLLYVDAVTVPVPDLDAGMAFYCGVLGHVLIWRNETVGQVGLRAPRSETEIVLSTRQGYEPDWKVASADAAAEVFRANGGRVLVEPIDIPIGRLAIVADPFGNRLVLLDSTKGTYDTDQAGTVSGVS